MPTQGDLNLLLFNKIYFFLPLIFFVNIKTGILFVKHPIRQTKPYT